MDQPSGVISVEMRRKDIVDISRFDVVRCQRRREVPAAQCQRAARFRLPGHCRWTHPGIDQRSVVRCSYEKARNWKFEGPVVALISMMSAGDIAKESGRDLRC